jgi:tetratricopeptide (TPR) repeat protein
VKRPWHYSQKFLATLRHSDPTAYVGVLSAIWLTLAITSVRTDASVYDEHSHILSGLSYLDSGQFSGGLGNPPLVQLLLTFPAWLARIPYRPYSDAHLLWFRVPAAVLGLSVGLVVYRWSASLHGKVGGFISLFLFAFCSLSMGLARYAILDFGSAAFFTFALFVLDRFLRNSTWINLCSMGLAIGAALTAKYTLLPLIVVGLIAAMAKPRMPRDARSRRAIGRHLLFGSLNGLVFLGGVVLVIDGVFLFRGVFDSKKLVIGLSGAFRPVAQHLTETVAFCLPTAFVGGVMEKLRESAVGRPAFLLGEWHSHGRWYYFPFALWLKTPIALHLLLLVFLWAVATRRIHLGYRHATLIVPTTGLVVLSLLSDINIGVRHVIFVFPVMYVLLGAVGSLFARSGMWSVLLPLLGTSYVMANMMVFPNYLEFFNGWVGGASEGYQYLIDSNLDWGQDDRLPILFARSHGLRQIAVNASPYRPRTGWMAISANCRQGLYREEPFLGKRGPWSWLTRFPPEKRLAHTWFVYHVSNEDFVRFVHENPKDTWAWLDLAILFRDGGNLSEAARMLARAETLSGAPFAEIAIRKGEIFLLQRKPSEALAQFVSARALRPDDEAIHLRVRLAEAEYKYAMLPGDGAQPGAQEEWVRAMIGRVQAYAELANFAKAGELLREMTESPAGGDPRILYWQGRLAYSLGDFERAAAAFSNAVHHGYIDAAGGSKSARLLDRWGYSPLAREQLALAGELERLGLLDAAFDHYRRSSEIDRTWSAPIWGMGRVAIARRLGVSVGEKD